MESVRRITQVLEVKEAGAVVPIDLVLPSEAKECFTDNLETTRQVATHQEVPPSISWGDLLMIQQ